MTVRPLSWLMLATHVPPTGRLGGMVRYVVELATELAVHPEVELSVLTTPATRPFFAELLGGPERVLTLPGLPTPLRSLLERPGYGVRAFRRDFDVVHGTKHLLPRVGSARRVLTVHDLLPMDRPQDFPRLKRSALVAPYRASVRSADALLCVSQATRRRLLADSPAVAERSSVVPLAVSSSLRQAVPAPVPELVRRRFALVVGDASPRKNLALVLSAWEAVVAREPAAVLAVVGPPGWGVDLRGSAYDRLVRQGAVIELTSVTDGVLRWCYENASVVACPSLLEGFGLPSVEALHFGAPLVTSEDPALVEASAGAGRHLPADDVARWADALLEAVLAPRPAVPGKGASRSWTDVAAETVSAVLPLARR